MEQSPERCDRSRALAGLVGVSLLVVAVAVTFQFVQSRALVQEQLMRRGRYIAANLAANSKYGVLTEDKPLLGQLLEEAVAAGDYAEPDVAGASVWDAGGAALASVGAAVSERPTSRPDQPDERAVVTTDGREALLFRWPVTVSGGRSAVPDPSGVRHVGSVEVALLTRPAFGGPVLVLVETLFVALLALVVASAVGWTLFLRPTQSREGPEPL